MEGLLIPLITPFAKDGSVALDALEELAHRVLDDGAAGLVPLGTTGEPATLTAAEKNAVMDTVAAVCRDRGALLIAGAGSNDTAGSVEAVKALAKWPEVTAALTVVPYYTRPGEAGVVAHFTRLAAESPVPLMLYNIPYRTGQVLGWQALRQLAAVPGIVGMKQAVGAVDEDTVRLMADKPESFAVFAGDDLYVSPLLALGAAGGILASAHVATDRFAALVGAWRAGDVARARLLGHRLAALSAAMFAEPNPVVVKAVLHAKGQIPSPGVRLPLLPASAEATKAALQAYEQSDC
ncbi:4-hydroxy-tetrahydrodipicolinate synthase [Fodinicola feengrottensis]